MEVALMRTSVPEGMVKVFSQGMKLADTGNLSSRRVVSSSPRSAERFTIIISVAPARATSTPMALAAPPAPKITTFLPCGLDDLHFVGDRTIETLETHCLCAVDGGLEVVRSDLNGEVAPVQSVMPVGCLHHDLSGVLGDWLPEGSRKFLFEV